MNKKKNTKLSSFMTKILRHNPIGYGLLLDEKGFCYVDDLLAAIQEQEYWKDVSVSTLQHVVETCEKQRYEMKEGKIRAIYGHSFQKITYEKKTPPTTLLHGTAVRFLDSILEEGLIPVSRQYVHMSETTHFASMVGKRHGELVLLEIDTRKAIQEGVDFYYAGNEVWLAEHIHSRYIKVKNQ